MEKITDKINALPDGANYFSLEFFPPKTAMVRAPLRGTSTGDKARRGELHCSTVRRLMALVTL